MKPWIKKTLIGFVGATILLGGLSACGHRGGHERGPMSEERVVEMRGKVIEHVSDKLELNEAQKLKLGVLADEMIAHRKAMRGDNADPRTEIQALVAGEKFDRSRAQTLLTQKTQVAQGDGPKMIAALGDFYDSLNPEQQKQVREKMQRRGWWGRGRGPHFGGLPLERGLPFLASACFPINRSEKHQMIQQLESRPSTTWLVVGTVSGFGFQRLRHPDPQRQLREVAVSRSLFRGSAVV